MQTHKSLASLAAFVALGAAAHGASSIVYSNATSYTGTILNPGLSEVGDEIILSTGDRFGELFRFEYYGLNFDLDETVRLRFYANDGAFLGNNTYEPSTLLFDSGVQSLPSPTDLSGRNTLQYDLNYITLPDRFTFSISFGGVSGDDVAGVALYNPPTVGLSENDYWFHNGTGWELRGTNVAINFGSSLVVTSVPEPSTYALMILGGLCGFALMQRRKRNS